MHRTTHTDVLGRLTVHALHDPGVDARDRAVPAAPSYVQSILFGRRWMRTAGGGSDPCVAVAVIHAGARE